MGMTRRSFMSGMTSSSAGTTVLGGTSTHPSEKEPTKRRHRTLYFNDARHYYMYVFEPPMKSEDVWRPVDEVAGTAVDTFIYGVASGGLFYPSKVGKRFKYEEHATAFRLAAFWRAWENMQSLIDRGLDPLTVLIDRAHTKGMDFFASLRMSSYEGMDPAHQLKSGGRGLAHTEVRDHQFAVLEELATRYDIEGVELDFAAAPGGMSFSLREEDVAEYTPVLTDYVRKISQMVRRRPGGSGAIGVRVYPTEQTCLERGLDVRTWLREGLLDYVLPMLYMDFTLDPNMPIDWLIQAAHEVDTAVYGILQPYVRTEVTGAPIRMYATPEITRAAAANHWSRGVDGLYTQFMRWPLGDAQRRTLTELGDWELIKEGNKHYVLRRRSKIADEMGYYAALPIEIPSADAKQRYSIPFFIADDIEGSSDRIRQIQLKLNIYNLVSADRLTLRLNGNSLEQETCLRDFGEQFGPYRGQWLEFQLKQVRPRKGQNLLEISLDHRPRGLQGGISVENVEIWVNYGSVVSQSVSMPELVPLTRYE